MFNKVRTFFSQRNVLEVDTDILNKSAPIDAFIDVMQVDMGKGKIGYLHTSPEYGLKKLLAKESGDIYQLGHVFRQDEESALHSPEFTMLEWYRIGMEYNIFIEETFDLTRLFLGDLPSEKYTYRLAFQTFAQIDPFLDDLIPHVLPFSPSAKDWDRDTMLDLLFTHLVEPHLGKEKLTAITDYPSSQAALAKKTKVDGFEVAKRFEIYFDGIELANGFDELTDSEEQRDRLNNENAKRIDLGKKSLPIDEEFLKALDTLPDCCGVAAGFDRLMMLSASSEQ